MGHSVHGAFSACGIVVMPKACRLGSFCSPFHFYSELLSGEPSSSKLLSGEPSSDETFVQ